MLRAVEYPDASRLDPAWDRARQPGQCVAMPGFLRAFECGGVKEVRLRYLGVYDGMRFLGGAAFSQVCFALDLLAPPAARAVTGPVKRIWPELLALRATTCGVFASQGSREIVLAEPSASEAVIDLLERRARALASASGSNVIVFKEFQAQETPIFDRLLRHGYVRLHSLPFASMDVRWRSFGEYLQSLRSGYRRQARANLAKRSLPGVSIDLAERIEDHADEFHALYMQVMDHANFHVETLTPEFFRLLGRELGLAVRLVALRRHGDLVGGALYVVDGECLSFMYVGFDYARLREHDTYFNLLYGLIEAAIETGARRLDFGQVSQEAKTRMGATLREVFAYAKGLGFPMAQVVARLGHQLYPARPMMRRRVFR